MRNNPVIGLAFVVEKGCVWNACFTLGYPEKRRWSKEQIWKKRENILQSDMDDKKKAAELEKLKKQYDRAVIGQMMRA